MLCLDEGKKGEGNGGILFPLFGYQKGGEENGGNAIDGELLLYILC
jgi:hypothetical protein